MSSLPPVVGQVPPEYNGPIFYRTRVVTYSYFRTPFYRQMSVENRDARKRLASADLVQVAHRMDRHLFDEAGNLLELFRAPLKARLLSSALKHPPEWAFGHVTIVSERVRNAVERLQPQSHLFIPFDVDDAGKLQRRYAFYVLRNTTRTVLAMRANDIEYTLADTGNPVFPTPEWLQSDRFAYANADVVGGAAVDFDSRVGIVMAKPLVDELGDVFPKGVELVPMGVVNEPLERLQ